MKCELWKYGIITEALIVSQDARNFMQAKEARCDSRSAHDQVVGHCSGPTATESRNNLKFKKKS